MPYAYRRNDATPSADCLRLAALNATNSPLLRLPRELRDQIYELVLYEGTHQVKKIHPPKQVYAFVTMACPAIRLVEAKPNLLSLLYVCRQIQEEAYLIPFGINRFEEVSKRKILAWNGEPQKIRFDLVGQPSRCCADQRPYMDIRPFL